MDEGATEDGGRLSRARLVRLGDAGERLAGARSLDAVVDVLRAGAGAHGIAVVLRGGEQQAFARASQMAGLPVPQAAMMDAQKQQMLQQLQGLGGPQFDRMYIQGQVAGHEELLGSTRRWRSPRRRVRSRCSASSPCRERHRVGLKARQHRLRERPFRVGQAVRLLLSAARTGSSAHEPRAAEA